MPAETPAQPPRQRQHLRITDLDKVRDMLAKWSREMTSCSSRLSSDGCFAAIHYLTDLVAEVDALRAADAAPTPGTALKYALGQRLWPVQSLNGRAFVQRSFDATVISLVGNETNYSFTHNYCFPECDVFASEAEARAECDRRNAAGGGGGRGEGR